MKRIISLVLCVAMSGIQAIDLHKDKVFQPLKVAIEQAQSPDMVEDIWDKLIAQENLSIADQRALANQALSYAKEFRDILKDPRARLWSDKVTLGRSYHRWAMVQAFGIQMSLFGLSWYLGKKFKFIEKGAGDHMLSWIFIPDMMLIKKLLPATEENKKRLNTYIYPGLALVRVVLLPYLLYKGLSNGQAYRKLMEKSVQNLDEVILYLDTKTVAHEKEV